MTSPLSPSLLAKRDFSAKWKFEEEEGGGSSSEARPSKRITTEICGLAGAGSGAGADEVLPSPYKAVAERTDRAASPVIVRIAEFFSGIGGIGRGFKDAAAELEIDLEVCYANEFNHLAADTYELNAFPEATCSLHVNGSSGRPERIISGVKPSQGSDPDLLKIAQKIKKITLDRRSVKPFVDRRDVTTIDMKTDPLVPSDIDIIVAGLPCQDFSYAGERAGIDGKRGSLYKCFAKVLKEKQPKYFLVENVQGILNHGGDTIIKPAFEAAGYYVSVHTIVFADFGVPQLRRRVLFIGIRNDLSSRVKFAMPHPTHGQGKLRSRPYVTAEEALKSVHTYVFNSVIPVIKKQSCLDLLNTVPEGGRVPGVDGKEGRKFRRIDRAKPFKTITGVNHGNGALHHWKDPRPLSDRETAIAQSLESFAFCGPKHDVALQIGNAVPPLGIKPVAKVLLELFVKSVPASDVPH